MIALECSTLTLASDITGLCVYKVIAVECGALTLASDITGLCVYLCWGLVVLGGSASSSMLEQEKCVPCHLSYKTVAQLEVRILGYGDGMSLK